MNLLESKKKKSLKLLGINKFGQNQNTISKDKINNMLNDIEKDNEVVFDK